MSSVCLSVVCGLSVTLLHPVHRLELFGNIFAPPNRAGTCTVYVKIFGKNSKGIWGIVQVKYKGYENLAFSAIISPYFENGTRYGHNYNGGRIRSRMRSIEWCHFQ